MDTRARNLHADVSRFTLEGYVKDEATIPRMFETFEHYISQWIDEKDGTVVFDQIRSTEYTGSGFTLMITMYYTV